MLQQAGWFAGIDYKHLRVWIELYTERNKHHHNALDELVEKREFGEPKRRIRLDLNDMRRAMPTNKLRYHEDVLESILAFKAVYFTGDWELSEYSLRLLMPEKRRKVSVKELMKSEVSATGASTPTALGDATIEYSNEGETEEMVKGVGELAIEEEVEVEEEKEAKPSIQDVYDHLEELAEMEGAVRAKRSEIAKMAIKSGLRKRVREGFNIELMREQARSRLVIERIREQEREKDNGKEPMDSDDEM
ncbi:hypothetical protein ABW20_dc0107926 [Dactylellina cionopaga]|nr:hypothetical protein ABW20_dc0107926 [Dactylellina cionopaga]